MAPIGARPWKSRTPWAWACTRALWHSWGFATVAMVMPRVRYGDMERRGSGLQEKIGYIVVWHRSFVFYRLVGVKVGELHKPSSKNIAFDFLTFRTDPRISNVNSLRFRNIRHVICAKKQTTGYSLVTHFCPGQILDWFLSSFFRFAHFKIRLQFQEKLTVPLTVMFSSLSSVESARAFPPFFFWPEKST